MPVSDPATRQVVWRELYLDLVARQDPDVVLSHLSGDRGQDGVTPVELHPEHRARERLGDLAFDLDLLFFVRHSPFFDLRARKDGGLTRREPTMVANRPLQGFLPG